MEPRVKEESKTSIQPMVDEMIVTHNCLIRSINATYLQCINIEKSPQGIPDFLGYCSVWGKFVHEHHKGEEDSVFPDIEQKTGVTGLMAGNIAQHDAFPRGSQAVRGGDHRIIWADFASAPSRGDPNSTQLEAILGAGGLGRLLAEEVCRDHQNGFIGPASEGHHDAFLPVLPRPEF
ncbi:hemerythrin HHE cation binding domain-containing protein [Seiridium cupressi]